MHPLPALVESDAGRQRWPEESPLGPLGARAFPPEFPSGSSDSRGKLNILGQGEAGCQVPTLHRVLPPPSPPPPLPPPTLQPSPSLPAAQIPAQSQRPRRCGCCCCCCRPRTRPLQPALEPISAGGESGFSTRNATGQPGEQGTVQRDRLIPAPSSSPQRRRGGDEGGRRGGRGLGRDLGRRPVLQRRSRRSYFSPPPSSSSLLLPPPPRRVAESPNQNKRRLRRLAPRAGPLQTAPPSHSRGSKHVTEPLCSAAWPPPGGSSPGLSPSPCSLYIPGRARPTPAPLHPPGRAAEAPALALCCSARAAPLRGRQIPGR